MSVGLVYGFLLLLNLFSHGKSVPIETNYYDEDGENQDILLNDITNPDYNERYARDIFSSPYEIGENRWYPRSRIPSRPITPHRRHFHLFHLTPKHPNAVSYHVIEKAPVHRTMDAQQHHQQFNNPAAYQSHNQQPTTYQQSPGYGNPSYPSYGDPKPVDTTYQDILQEVANPMRFPSYPPYHHVDGSQRDNVVNNIEEAAKEFNKISADMNSMEMAALVMVPYHPSHKKRHHHKKLKSKNNKKKLKKIKHMTNSTEKSFEKNVEKKTNLLTKLIRNNKKDKNDDDDMNYEDSAPSSGDSWDEEDSSTTSANKRSKTPQLVNTEPKRRYSKNDSKKSSDAIGKNGDDEYASSKRSEIPHVFDQVSNSNDDENISS